MTNATVSRLGTINADTTPGNQLDLFYKLFTGEVLTAYEKKTIMQGRHRQRNITHGKSAAFAVTGKASGRYHAPGTEILGQRIKHAETVITIDDLLIADVFIANVDEAMNHYDVRAEYTNQLGQALARTYDKQNLRIALKAARTLDAEVSNTDHLGGDIVELTLAYNTNTALQRAQELAGAIFAAHLALVEKDAPMEGVFCAIRPADYFNLVQNKDLLNKDWGGVGSYAMAELPMIAGIPLVMTNLLPTQLDAVDGNGVYFDGGDVISTKYAGDWRKTVALIMTPDAIGSVNLLDLQIESQYDIRRQGTLFVAKKLSGSGVLRPSSAVEIQLYTA